MGDATYDQAAERAGHQDRKVRFGDDGVGNTKEHANHNADEPSRPRQLHERNDESDSEATEESGEQGSALVGERHRQHQGDVDGTEDQTANQAENKA